MRRHANGIGVAGGASVFTKDQRLAALRRELSGDLVGQQGWQDVVIALRASTSGNPVVAEQLERAQETLREFNRSVIERQAEIDACIADDEP